MTSSVAAACRWLTGALQAALYPHPDKVMHNTSQVDVEAPDLDRFPAFSSAQGWACCLAPGEMLYIPPRVWHHVRAAEQPFSISLSHWW